VSERIVECEFKNNGGVSYIQEKDIKDEKR
jgi:hypothetical protein